MEAMKVGRKDKSIYGQNATKIDNDVMALSYVLGFYGCFVGTPALLIGMFTGPNVLFAGLFHMLIGIGFIFTARQHTSSFKKILSVFLAATVGIVCIIAVFSAGFENLPAAIWFAFIAAISLILIARSAQAMVRNRVTHG